MAPLVRKSAGRLKTVSDVTLTVRSGHPGCVIAEAHNEEDEFLGNIFACSRGSGELNVTNARSYGKRGSRIGTKLYEMLAEYACSQGMLLGSDIQRTKFAEAFWRKQFDKGRASHYCIRRDVTEREDGSIKVTESARECPPDERVYSADGATLISSKHIGHTRYRLKSCPAPASLEGMKRRRK